MLPDDVLIHGYIFQFIRRKGRLDKLRRWAYISQDSLFIFPDEYSVASCYKIFLKDAETTITYSSEDIPWISITDHNDVTYFIQPEKNHKFQNWLSAIHKATKQKRNQTERDFLPKVFETLNIDVSSPRDAAVYASASRTPVDTKGSVNGSITPDVYSNVRAPRTPPRRIPPSHRGESKQSESRMPVTKGSISPSRRHEGRHSRSSAKTPRPDRPSRVQEKAPPLPPRSARGLRTVRENADMPDEQVLPTKPVSDLRSMYPVSGLAKRMSICASDLLGKSRNELILLLLQLNREKANLQRWYNYFMDQVDEIRKAKGDSPDAEEQIAAIQTELTDVTDQLHLSEPLVKFLGNMLRMGDMFHGDDVMFASEYRAHLLPENVPISRNDSLRFARDVEAYDVAQALNASLEGQSARTLAGSYQGEPFDQIRKVSKVGDYDSTSFKSGMTKQGSVTQLDLTETAPVELQRSVLKEELAKIEALCASHKTIRDELRATQSSLQRPILDDARPKHNTISYSGRSASLVRKYKTTPEERLPAMFDEYVLSSRNVTPRVRSPASEFHPSSRTQSRIEHESHVKKEPINPESGENVKRFRSIPDHLHLLTEAGFPVSRMQALNTEWKVTQDADANQEADEYFTRHSPKLESRSTWGRSTTDEQFKAEQALAPRQRSAVYESTEDANGIQPSTIPTERTILISRDPSILRSTSGESAPKYEPFKRASTDRAFESSWSKERQESTVLDSQRRAKSEYNSSQVLERPRESKRASGQLTEQYSEPVMDMWDTHALKSLESTGASITLKNRESQHRDGWLKDITVSSRQISGQSTPKDMFIPLDREYSPEGRLSHHRTADNLTKYGESWTKNGIPKRTEPDEDAESFMSLMQGRATQNQLRDALLRPDEAGLEKSRLIDEKITSARSDLSFPQHNMEDEGKRTQINLTKPPTPISSGRQRTDVLHITPRRSTDLKDDLAPESIDRVSIQGSRPTTISRS